MNPADLKRADKLLAIMDDARRRQVHAQGDYIRLDGGVKAEQRLKTYERQCARYQQAADELRAILARAGGAA